MQAMVLSCDSRLSKTNNRPSSTFSFVKGLSAGITTEVSSRPKGILSLYSVADWAFAAGVAIKDDSIAIAQMARTPETVFRSWVDGGSSAFGVTGFIAAPSVCIFITFDPLSLIGYQSFLVVIWLYRSIRGSKPTGTVSSRKSYLSCSSFASSFFSFSGVPSACPVD
jgi:hypothetical protein